MIHVFRMTGADLAFVFCAEEAAVPIKCYSPELMVAPVYNTNDFNKALHLDGESGEAERMRLVKAMVSSVSELFDRMHVLIIGPGLGRNPLVMQATGKIITLALQKHSLSLVLDADALYLLTLEPYQNIISKYKHRVIISPNAVEYRRLIEAHKWSRRNFTHVMEGVLVVEKGMYDIISLLPLPPHQNHTQIIECKEEGGMKRSGGLGDILAGVLGTLVAWNNILHKEGSADSLLLSCWTACCITKRCTNIAFQKKRRSMTAPDVLEEIGEVVDQMTTTNID